ncbi:unnamed protein product [Orchesella dallaii]|uniref:Uncharacterized protein n=1 Tax=Orchesella dallaii TaxID=48710 RepID=A0ABP1R388_9HEXA
MASNSKPGCCISSITGAYIVGILEIIITAILTAYTVGISQPFQATTRESLPLMNNTMEVKLGLEPQNVRPNDNRMNTLIANLIVVGPIVHLVLFLLLPAIVLILGIWKERLRLLQFRMLVHGFLIVSVPISIIIKIILITNISTTFFFIAGVSFGVGIICFTVVYCAYVKIRNNLAQKQLGTNPSLKCDLA